MLHALMDGVRAGGLELARIAGITPQTTSGHLTRVTAIGLLKR
jgi:DNA-binding CsgD family transcriptional regulator